MRPVRGSSTEASRRRHQWWVAQSRTVALKAGRKRKAGAGKGMLPWAPRTTASDAAAVAACAVPRAARARSARAWVPASVSYPCGRVHSCPILHSCSEHAAPVWGRRRKGIACHARLPQPLQDALTARTRGGVCFRARRSLPRVRACRAAWLLPPAALPPSRLALCAEEPLSSDCGASCHRCGARCHRSGEHARVRAAQTRDGQPRSRKGGEPRLLFRETDARVTSDCVAACSAHEGPEHSRAAAR